MSGLHIITHQHRELTAKECRSQRGYNEQEYQQNSKQHLREIRQTGRIGKSKHQTGERTIQKTAHSHTEGKQQNRGPGTLQNGPQIVGEKLESFYQA